MEIYTVFVDGEEVNDFYLTLEQAKVWHDDFTFDGYEPYIYKVIFNKDKSVKEYIYVPMPEDKV